MSAVWGEKRSPQMSRTFRYGECGLELYAQNVPCTLARYDFCEAIQVITTAAATHCGNII
jgi:hypothetical protein